MSRRFSTPINNQLYPEAPYHYDKAKIFLALFNPPEGVIEKIIPEPLKPPSMPLAAVMFGEQPCREAGIFFETAILVQCMFDNPETKEEEVGVYFAHAYADTDVAIVAGREIWGYPRKRATTTMDWEGDTLTAKTIRNGNTVIEAKCILDDEGEWIDSGPNLNTKLVPSVDGQGHSVAVITAAYLDYDIINGRSGEVEITLSGGPHDDFSLIEIETPMIGLYFDTNITLPWGKVIAKI
jgi:acetoacetate decarboxylase